MKLILLAFALGLTAIVVRADSVNPASNVTADSANTASTIVYRDTSGNFAAGAVTVTTLTAGSIVNTGTQSLQVATTAQIALRTDPVGTLILSQSYLNGTLNASQFGLCVSTQAVGASAHVYVATKTATNIGTDCK